MNDDEITETGAAASNRHHPEQGAKLVLPLKFSAEIGQIIAYHHERWDGAGYPFGLKEEGVPRLARIVCLAQTFDHLTAELPGRMPLSIDDACREIRAYAGTHFEPNLTELFVRMVQECKGSLPAMAMATTPTDRSDS